MLPSAKYLPKSPVLYNLREFSSLPKGLGINLSAVKSGRFRYPLAKPAPPIYISPSTPTGTGFR